jgi:hypothetical protein
LRVTIFHDMFACVLWQTFWTLETTNCCYDMKDFPVTYLSRPIKALNYKSRQKGIP